VRGARASHPGLVQGREREREQASERKSARKRERNRESKRAREKEPEREKEKAREKESEREKQGEREERAHHPRPGSRPGIKAHTYSRIGDAGYRCRANMAHIIQSGVDFQTKVLNTF